MFAVSRFMPHNIEGYFRLVRDFAPLLIGAGIAVRTWMKYRAAHSWPTTQGTVWSTQSRPGERGERAKWVAELTYSYTVNSEYYSGTRPIKARNEQEADRIAAEWKARNVSVRYEQSKPASSALLLEDQPGGTLLH